MSDAVSQNTLTHVREKKVCIKDSFLILLICMKTKGSSLPSAERSVCDLHDDIRRLLDLWHRPVLESDLVRAVEHDCFHGILGGHFLFLRSAFCSCF